jgi:putative DNA primase/helicase
MRARYMRQDEFEFTPVLKLLIIGNNKPGLSSVDDAARRRFNLLPFLFKPAVPDPQLEEKLRAEWPAILRWMIEGCLDWQANRLVRPEVVKAATDEYFATQDMFSLWLEERCIVDRDNPHRQATSRELFESWNEYARANNEPSGTQTSFGEQMDKQGFRKKEKVPTGVGSRARGYCGIELRPQPSRAAE